MKHEGHLTQPTPSFREVADRCNRLSPKPKHHLDEIPECSEVKPLQLGACSDGSKIVPEYNGDNSNLKLTYPTPSGRKRDRTVKLHGCNEFIGIRILEEMDGSDLGVRIECYYN